MRARLIGDVTIGLAQLIRAVPFWRVRVASAMRHYGLTVGALAAISAAKDPAGTALVDDAGPLSYAELDRQADDLAAALAGRLPSGEATLGVLCRNGRSFVLAVIAGARLGAEVILLNTEFSPSELAAVIRDERVQLVLRDGDDLAALPADVSAFDLEAHLSASLTERGAAGPTAHAAAKPNPHRRSWRPSPEGRSRRRGLRDGWGRSTRRGRLVVLTSGTTGPAKGAHRGKVRLAQAIPITTLVRRIPLRAGGPMILTPPLFHGFGLGFLALGLAFGLPVVLSRRLDAVRVNEWLATHRGCLLVGVPPVLARIERAGGATGAGGHVAAVVSGAGLLHPSVAARLTASYGRVLYNLYGSSEEGWSTLATPADLAAAPGTIGRPPAGVKVSVLDDDGHPVGPGRVGHLCVGSRLEFSHYTGGGRRRRLGGLSDSGDLGHRDDDGRFFIDGRADDMVVTGGENVFTTEIEDVLLSHPAVAEARVDGLPDKEFGIRLEAYVVPAGSAPTADLERELTTFAQARLARFKVPRRIRTVDCLPLTATGKHSRGVT